MFFLADRLKRLRKEKGKYQKDIAQLLNMSERQYRYYESISCDMELPLSKCIILADYFEVSLDYLVGRSNDSKIQPTSQLSLTSHEKLLLSEYRKQTNIKLSIDRLLGIEEKETTALKIARSSTSKVVEITDDFSDLINANSVNSDEDL